MSRRVSSRLLGLGVVSGCLAAVAFALLSSCRDPAEPPRRIDHEYRGVYDAIRRSLTFPEADLDPSLGPLRFVATNVAFDSAVGQVLAHVALHNSGSTPIVGPDVITVFGVAPAHVVVNQPCRPPAAAISDCAHCFFTHRGTYGADGILSAGETSQAVPWIFSDRPNDSFEFRARYQNCDLSAPGEISGVFFDDANANGRRDAGEIGVVSAFVRLAGPDSVTGTRPDSSGRYSFFVARAGNYRATGLGWGCCPTTPRGIDIAIERQPDGQLSSYGRADYGCQPGATRFPEVDFVDVRTSRPDIPPCTAAAPCTIPFLTSFEVRFTGRPSCDPITGFQWQGIRPAEADPEPFQPLGSDTLFLPAGHDTVAVDHATADTLWSVRRDTVTVHYKSIRGDTIRSGNFVFRARIRDAFGLVSWFSPGTRRVVVNFDPETQLDFLAACECPSPPVGCASRATRRVGWITGIGQVDFPLAQWRPFCAGDTIPIHSMVRFFARGQDDVRDEPLHPGAGLRETGYSFRFTAEWGDFVNRNMPFSIEYAAQDLSHPSGARWRGASIGWRTCPFDFTLFASAVDEHGKRDGTPDSISFYAGGTPVIDSVSVPPVVVLVPTCPPGTPWCREPGSFGPDTLVVRGRHVPWSGPPLLLGRNEFTLPIVAMGHDHPRDRNRPGRVYYAAADEGAIRAWNFRLDCTDPGCSDLSLQGEGTWVDDIPAATDPPGQQVLDDLRFTVPLDTLITGSPPALHVVLGTRALGPYVFSIQGRDARVNETCREPSDLGPNPATFLRPNPGRSTQIVTRAVVLRQLQDVRGAASKARVARTAGARHIDR